MYIKIKSVVSSSFVLLVAAYITIAMTVVPAYAATSCTSVPTINLKFGDTNDQVKTLQQLLNTSLSTQVATVGPGSPGNESTYFGPSTKAAIIRLQNQYPNDVLIPNGLSHGTGYVGPSTRNLLASVCDGTVTPLATSPTTVSTSTIITLPQTSSNTATASVVSSTQSLSQIKNSTYTGTRHRTSKTNPISVTPAPTTSTTTNPIKITPPPATSTPVISPITTNPTKTMQWGAYVGDASTAISSFEATAGQKTTLVATFDGWDTTFPTNLASSVGQQGKTLIVFWEPNFGYDTIINGSEDSYISSFAAGAKSYGYPVILVPFDEMNLSEQAWGYNQNGNTAAKFKTAWQHIHDLFVAAGATNVKFGIAYNNVSVPNTTDNSFTSYYPGAAYVDYVGVDGFNFGNPWQTFGQVFDSAIGSLQQFNKPIYIFSMGSADSLQKAAWITEGLSTHVKTYQNVIGWIWFNQNDASVAGSGDTVNWLIDSNSAASQAFKAVVSGQ